MKDSILLKQRNRRYILAAFLYLSPCVSVYLLPYPFPENEPTTPGFLKLIGAALVALIGVAVFMITLIKSVDHAPTSPDER